MVAPPLAKRGAIIYGPFGLRPLKMILIVGKSATAAMRPVPSWRSPNVSAS
jgi:hypothetical protein